jgi:hypothetical protein
MPFPEQRHLLGRLLNELPWRASLSQPAKTPHPVLNSTPCQQHLHLACTYFPVRLTIALSITSVTLRDQFPADRPAATLRNLPSPQTGRFKTDGSLIRPMTLAATKETVPIALNCHIGMALSVIAMRDIATTARTPSSKTAMLPEALVSLRILRQMSPCPSSVQTE